VSSSGGPAADRNYLDAVADRDLVTRGLAKLSDEERETVALRFGADLTVKQIVATLGEPESTIDGRVYRALRKLRRELG